MLGTCLPIDGLVGPGYSAAQDLIEYLERSEEAFLKRIAFMCGRHAIFYCRASVGSTFANAAGDIHVVGDATGMRTIFHGPGGVASHARLAAADDAPRDSLPHQWGFPGNHTPWTGVRLLTPNTRLNCATGQVRRLFPVSSPSRRSGNEAAAIVAPMVKTALLNFSRTSGKLCLGLTAGIDSRTTLALAVSSGIDITSFTHIHNAKAAKDAALAADLASAVGVAHFTLPIPRDPIPMALRRQYAYASYYLYEREIAEAMRKFSKDWPTFLSSNTLEIARAFYQKRAEPPDSPLSPQAAATLYTADASQKKRSAIEAYGRALYDGKVLAATTDLFATADTIRAFEYLDPFDLYYWEHRMPAWHGIRLLVRDFACDTFVPFNARSIFETLLGVDLRGRQEFSVFRSIINSECPSLGTFPINPQHWPKSAASPRRSGVFSAPVQ